MRENRSLSSPGLTGRSSTHSRRSNGEDTGLLDARLRGHDAAGWGERLHITSS
jgi:hypothetical protein